MQLAAGSKYVGGLAGLLQCCMRKMPEASFGADSCIREDKLSVEHEGSAVICRSAALYAA